MFVRLMLTTTNTELAEVYSMPLSQRSCWYSTVTKHVESSLMGPIHKYKVADDTRPRSQNKDAFQRCRLQYKNVQCIWLEGPESIHGNTHDVPVSIFPDSTLHAS